MKKELEEKIEKAPEWRKELEPIIDEENNEITIIFMNGGGAIVFRFSDIEQTKSKEIETLLAVECPIVGMTNMEFSGRINILSLSARETFSRQLSKSFKMVEAPWDLYLSRACDKVRKAFQNRVEAKSLGQMKPQVEEKYLLEPYIVEGGPNLIFGMGGTGKTYLTLGMSFACATGATFLGLTSKRKVKTLFIDYEASEGAIYDRVMRIASDPLHSKVTIEDLYENFYRFDPKGVPLHDCVQSIKKIVKEKEIGLIILDSVALACGGEPEKAESAIRYFNALSAIGCTSLSIAHETKAQENKYAFGTIFWHNSPRNIWNARSESEQEDKTIVGGIAHRKSNDDRLRSPQPYKITFESKHTELRLGQQFQVEHELSIPKRIRKCLGGGKKTVEQIMDAMPDVQKESLRVILNRLKEKGEIEKTDNMFWGLVSMGGF